jgi:hypothetical protein
VIFWQPMFCTKLVTAIIALKGKISFFSTVHTINSFHNFTCT